MKKIIFIILFIPFFLFAQQEAKVDSLLRNLAESNSGNKIDIENSITAMLYKSEMEPGRKISEYLQRILPDSKFQELYVKILIHSWRFYPFKEKINLLNKAYPVAKKLNDYNLIGTVEVYKAIAFRDNSMTDSAMTYALKASDNLEKSGNPEDLDDVTNLIADLHYWAGQYEEAEVLYKQLLSQPRMKNHWRYYTIQDDLGLIRIKQKKYSEAETYFKKTLNSLTSKNMQHTDSTALPYVFRMLLEINVERKHFTEAGKYYGLSLKLAERFEQNEYLPAIYAYKGDIYFDAGKYDSAITFYYKALELNKITPNIEDSKHIYEGLSKTYDAINDIKNVNKYLVLLNQAENTADSIFYRSRYMTTFAKYNYNKFKREISGFKERQSFLMIFIVIISVSLFTIGYFFIRLGKANRKLVTKSIEAANLPGQFVLLPGNKIEDSERLEPSIIKEEDDVKKTGKELDQGLVNDIIYKLEKIMSDEKLYLKPEVSMDQLSVLLATNRAYLSKAINNTYNINFSTYINDLRIKEAVRLISDGEHKDFSIEGIAAKAGFSNRVSFTKAFYKSTGVTPSFFIKHAGDVVNKENFLNNN